ncbi:lantibiotic dehydratase family protein [Chryseobacterium gregarium]|uniref:lantibiotic dehydratase family protein n=1 Tax=Chryseobacterium gregarium TaxID=456299 RepID=UPI0003F5CF44|nr:lantibiotic dehydratase family protein [Chryseobacterium gregarium]
MKKKLYKPFENYLLRTPVLSLNFYKNLTAEPIISDNTFKNLITDLTIREAVFLASPSLLAEFDSWLNNPKKDEAKIEKLKYTLLKYVSRMSSRCTPYGLFASCSIGQLSSDTDIRLNDKSKYKRHTRLDMNFMVSLYYELLKIEEIRNSLKLYPNTSLFKISDKYRYVEYHYKNGSRQYEIVAVDYSEYLEKLITAAQTGVTKKDLIKILMNMGFEENECEEFIDEIILSQILVFELEPNVAGQEYHNQLISILDKNEITISAEIKNILKKIETLDHQIGNSIEKYNDIKKLVEIFKVSFDSKHLFQCDLISTSAANFLDQRIAEQIIPAIRLLNKISPARHKSYLEKFKDRFYERYENMEIPLMVALDPEIGIGYGSKVESNDFNPLIDDLPIRNKHVNETQELKWSLTDIIFQEKFSNALKDKKYKITITDDDFKSIDNPNENNLPPTISIIAEIIREESDCKISFSGWGGGSAANLMSRFCHSDDLIDKHVANIISSEKSDSNTIIAEVIHLPESRVGNILSRPSFRDFEIPYLAKSTKDQANQIRVEDLVISVKNDRLYLKHSKLNKEIIPRLTNAHNFSNPRALPVYHFLCDMQFIHHNRGGGIPLTNFESLYSFIPRIEYKNIILSPAHWYMKNNDIVHLFKIKDDVKLLNEVKILKDRFSFSQFILLSDGDNELLINLENLTSIKMFLSTIKNRTGFKLSEFLHDFNNSIVKDEHNDCYSNEFIISFKVE